MLFANRLPRPGSLRAALRAAIRMDETRCVEERLAEAMLAPDVRDRIDATARQLVEEIRRHTQRAGGLDAFVAEYELSSEEGVAGHALRSHTQAGRGMPGGEVGRGNGTAALTLVGLVAQIFGPRYTATLFGIVFFSYQVGSFLGAWLGGYFYDLTGTYEVVWWLSVALGVFSGLVHWPIDERPVARLAAASAE